MPLDLTKPVQTRDGKPARILCTDRRSGYPVIAFVGEKDLLVEYRADGTYGYTRDYESPLDLVNVPTKVTRWINVHPNPARGYTCSMYETEEKANLNAYSTRVACIPIEFEVL